MVIGVYIVDEHALLDPGPGRRVELPIRCQRFLQLSIGPRLRPHGAPVPTPRVLSQFHQQPVERLEAGLSRVASLASNA